MEQVNFTPEQIQVVFLTIIFSVAIFVAISYIVVRFMRFLEIKLKIIRIRKIARKTSLEGYAVKTNEKGVPVLLINKDNPVEIFVL